MKKHLAYIFQSLLILLITVAINAQTELLTNGEIIEMSKVGLQSDVIITKIRTSETKFDTTAKALIELKKEKVDDKVIAEIINTAKNDERLKTRRVETIKTGNTELSESAPEPTRNVNYKTPAQLLREAKTVAFKKNSAYPKIKELESSLLKKTRADRWNKFGLVITQYAADADLLVDIGHDFGTHYNFRVVDTKTGRVITASGVSSLGGALAGNVADKLIKRLDEILTEGNQVKK